MFNSRHLSYPRRIVMCYNERSFSVKKAQTILIWHPFGHPFGPKACQLEPLGGQMGVPVALLGPSEPTLRATLCFQGFEGGRLKRGPLLASCGFGSFGSLLAHFSNGGSDTEGKSIKACQKGPKMNPKLSKREFSAIRAQAGNTALPSTE